MLMCLRALAFAAPLSFAAHVSAEPWPTRPVTLVVPAVAGGPSDVAARIYAQRLSEILGQQVIIENIGGAGGTIGTARVAKAPPDGSQFVFGSIGTHVWSQLVYKRPAYNSLTDFTPVALINGGARVLVTRKDFPADSLPMFIRAVRDAGDKVSFGSAGAGSVSHVACLFLNGTAKLNPTHIPYRGSAPALQDLIGGRIDYMCEAAATVLGYIESKSVKAIALFGNERSVHLPGVAPANEQGLPGFQMEGWNAVFLPAGTPDEIVRRLNQATNEALDTPVVRQRFEALAANVIPREQRTPEYLARLLPAELDRWSKVLKEAGLVLD